MAISKPRDKTKRIVLARCGNQCAFPSCTKPIFDATQLLGHLAHIKGNRPGSARHDSSQDPEERQGANNLIAMCKEHGILIDDIDNADKYPVKLLTSMKTDHEEKVEQTADRNWIKPPNFVTGGQFGATTVRFWHDRFGKPRIYSDEQLAILGELLALNLDFSALGTTLKALRSINSTEVKSVLQQSYAEIGNEEELYKRLAQHMAVALDVTFGEFLHFIVDGGDATPLFTIGNKRKLDIMEGREPSYYFPREPSNKKDGQSS